MKQLRAVYTGTKRTLWNHLDVVTVQTGHETLSDPKGLIETIESKITVWFVYLFYFLLNLSFLS